MTEVEHEIEQPQATAASEPAAAPEPDPEPVDFLAVVQQRPSRTMVGRTLIGVAVRGRISGARSMREREIPADALVWLTGAIRNYEINGAEVSGRTLVAGIEAASAHTIPRCRCDECQAWRAERLELATHFGLL